MFCLGRSWDRRNEQNMACWGEIYDALALLFCTLTPVMDIELHNTLREGTPCCNLTAILSVCSETRSWLVHLSFSGPWPRWRARPTPGTSVDGNVSPARRSAPGWRRCEAFSSWAASGSGKGGRYDGSLRRVRGQLKRAKNRIHLTLFDDSSTVHLVDYTFELHASHFLKKSPCWHDQWGHCK